MKKFILFLGFAALLSGLSSCTKNQTELSSETISTKVKVYGYIEYKTYSSNGSSMDNEFTGTADVFYRNTSVNPQPGYSHTTVAVRDGMFELELGCPAGQSLDVKVQASVVDDTYSHGSTQTAYFFGSTSKVVTCGDAVYIKVNMAPSAYPEDPDAN